MLSHWRTRLDRVVGTPRREAVLVGIGVALLYWGLRLSLPLVLGVLPDDAVYVALGKAIASGHGYHSIYVAGEPVHVKYPPGLPLVLAAVWLLGRSLATVTVMAHVLSVLVTATAAGAVWWIGRDRLGLHPLVVFVCAIGPFLIDGAILYFSLPISEPYFVLGWATALLVAYRLQQRGTVGLAVVLGLVVAATTLLRTEAVAVLAGVLLALMLRRTSWRIVGAYLGAAALPLLAWGLLHARLVAAGPVSTQPDELPYEAWLPVHGVGDPIRLAVAALRVNWPIYWTWFAAYITDVKVAGIVVLATCLALAIAGGLLVFRRHPELWCTTLGAAGVVMLWPWPQDRFAFGYLPFAGLLAGVTVQAGLRHAAPRSRGLMFAGLVLFAAGITWRQATLRQFAYLPVSTRAILGIPYPGHFIAANTRFVRVASAWLRDHTRQDDRILVDAPAAIYLYTGRHTVAASPAASAIAPDVFGQPGHYLAGRILQDSVSVVVLTDLAHSLARDIAVFFQRCPGTLTYLGAADWWGQSRAFFYRVSKRDDCAERLGGAP